MWVILDFEVPEQVFVLHTENEVHCSLKMEFNTNVLVLLSGASSTTFPGTKNVMNVGLSGQEELVEHLIGVILGDPGNGTGKPQEAHMDALKTAAVPHTKSVGVLHTKSAVVRHTVNLLTSVQQNGVDQRSHGLRSAVDLQGMYGKDLHKMAGRKNLRSSKVLAVQKLVAEESMKSGHLQEPRQNPVVSILILAMVLTKSLQATLVQMMITKI